MGIEENKPEGAAQAPGSAGSGQSSGPAAKLSGGVASISPQARTTGLLFLLAFVPALMAYGTNLWQRPHYQFFPLALVGAGMLAWRALKEHTPGAQPGSRKAMFWLMGTALVLLVVAAVCTSPWLGIITGLIVVTALALGSGGRPFLRRLSPALILLLTLVCLPSEADRAFVFRLRHFAVLASGYVLDTFHVPFVLYGNIIEIRGHKLLVNEACSGINSAFFVMALGLFHGLWFKRRWWQVLAVTLVSISFVLLGNVVRIAGGALLSHRWDIDILSGWAHETVGLILFAIYVGLIASADRLFVALVEPAKSRIAPAPVPAGPVAAPRLAWQDAAKIFWEPFRTAPGRLVLSGAVAYLVAGMLLGTSLAAGNHLIPHQLSLWSRHKLKPNANFSLPETVAGWQRLPKEQYVASMQERFDDISVLHSQSWAFRSGTLVALFSFDFPYEVYHDLTPCYTGAGWEVREAKFFPGAPGGSYEELSMRKKPFLDGYLLQGAFLPDGRWYDGFTGLMRLRFGAETGPVQQVQVLVATPAPLAADQKEQVRLLFDGARQELIKQYVAQLERKP